MSDQPPSLPPSTDSPAQPVPTPPTPAESEKRNTKGCFIAAGIVLGIVVILAIAGIFAYRYYFHAHIRPTKLSEQEQTVLNEKLETVESAKAKPNGRQLLSEGEEIEVLPSISEEERARQREMERRTITFTQRELNGMLYHNTDLGDRLKITFKEGSVDVDLLIPFEEDVPVVGGKTIRTGLAIAIRKHADGHLELIIEDVTVGGVPLPNAWLGDLKGVNLIEEYKDNNGILRAFSEGIEEIDIERGQIRVRLAE